MLVCFSITGIQAQTFTGGLNSDGIPPLNTVGLGGSLIASTTIDMSNGFSFSFVKSTRTYFNILNDGNIGIYKSNPTERLDVSGNFRLSGAFMPDNLPGTIGQILTSAGAGLPPKWAPPAMSWLLGGNANTIPGTNFLGTTDLQPVIFKVNNTHIGKLFPVTQSVSFGDSTNTPSGINSFTSGRLNTAGSFAFAAGAGSQATGSASVAMGATASASGPQSFAFGTTVQAKAVGGVTIGRANDITDAPTGVEQATDRIFQIGNGNATIFDVLNPTNTNVTSRSNVLTVLRNGNHGIGTVLPTEKLEVNGSVKITDGTQG